VSTFNRTDYKVNGPNFSKSFESFSEDPYLSGILSGAYINGVQKGGIGATIKHFVYGLCLYKLLHL